MRKILYIYIDKYTIYREKNIIYIEREREGMIDKERAKGKEEGREIYIEKQKERGKESEKKSEQKGREEGIYV